jgi:hypothetical protein
MSVQARLRVQSITDFGASKQVKLHAVYSNDPATPNYTYSQATPQAELTMHITNPGAFSQFVVGKDYDLVFTPVEEDAHA